MRGRRSLSLSLSLTLPPPLSTTAAIAEIKQRDKIYVT